MLFACLNPARRTPTPASQTRCLLVAASWLFACSCGGSTQPAEAPQTDSVEAPSTESDSEASAASDSLAEATEETATDERDEASTPRDTLIREGTAFILNFEKSDIGIEEKQKCEKRSGGDIAKEANCYATAMNKYPREGILFEKSNDEWFYVRFGLIKNARVDFNKVKVDIGEPSGNKIVLTPVGPDKAARRKGRVPQRLEFTVVDEYTVELADPSRGKLVYEPKLGLFAAE